SPEPTPRPHRPAHRAGEALPGPVVLFRGGLSTQNHRDHAGVRFTPHAYFVAYVIYMAGVFDKRGDTIRLPRLFRHSKAPPQLIGQDAAAVDALLVEAKPVADKVLILRPKAFAHRSAHISYDDVFKMAAVRPDQLRDLTDLALKIANRLLLARGLQDQYFTEL